MIESCDMLLVLQDGRLLDYGDAKEILDGLASGWKRFVSARALTSAATRSRSAAGTAIAARVLVPTRRARKTGPTRRT